MKRRYFYFAAVIIAASFLVSTFKASAQENLEGIEAVYTLADLDFEFENLLGKKIWAIGYYGDEGFSSTSGVGYLVRDYDLLFISEEFPPHSFARIDGNLPPHKHRGAKILVYGTVKNFGKIYRTFTVKPTPLITVERYEIITPRSRKPLGVKERLGMFFSKKDFFRTEAAFANDKSSKAKKPGPCDRALIISGGIDTNNNAPRYKDDIIAKYKKLKELGFTDEQIDVVYNDGSEVEVDGKNITDSKASKEKIKDIFEKYKKEMKKCCTLTIFVTDHGAGYSPQQGYVGARPVTTDDPGGITYPEGTFAMDLTEKYVGTFTFYNRKRVLWKIKINPETGRMELFHWTNGEWVKRGEDANDDGKLSEEETGRDINGDGQIGGSIKREVVEKQKHRSNVYDTDRDGNDDVRISWDGEKFIIEIFRDGEWKRAGEDKNGDHLIDEKDGGLDWNGDGDTDDNVGFHEGICLWGKEILWDDELDDMLKELQEKGVHILVEMVQCFGGGFIGNLKGIVEKIVTSTAEDRKHFARKGAGGQLYHAFQKGFLGGLDGIDMDSWNRAYQAGVEADKQAWIQGGRGPKSEPMPQKWEIVIPADKSEKEEEKKEEEKEGVKEGVQYKNAREDKTSCDVGIRYEETPDGMNIEVSAMATGKGIDFRRWEVTSIKLVIDGEKIKPDKSDKFYVPKQSLFQKPAALVFAAIGSRYTRYADEAESGKICPVTGKKTEAGREGGAISKGIDRAGMAAGMGLLVSQARGEITGQKAGFKLNKNMAQKVNDRKGIIEIIAENKEEQRRERFKIPLTE